MDTLVIFLFLVFFIVVAFLGWILYDCGFDAGYTKAWNEAHPDRPSLETLDESA